MGHIKNSFRRNDDNIDIKSSNDLKVRKYVKK